LAVTRANFKLVKNRRSARSVFAEPSLPSFSQRLRFAAAATCETATAKDPSRRCLAQPRAPPLS
jgi:hypothetical protein